MSPTRAEPFPGDPPESPKPVAGQGLHHAEYQRIEAMLGRAPTGTDPGIFAAPPRRPAATVGPLEGRLPVTWSVAELPHADQDAMPRRVVMLQVQEAAD